MADRDSVKTEQQLSDIFEDFIDMVPMGKTFFADRNPVRTGGPMQVGVAFAEAHARAKPYPYPVTGSIRNEVFSRRGGMYFGIAHLLDYPASYDRPIYRFADYKESMIDLLARVITVSLETVKITGAMRALPRVTDRS